MEKDKELKSQEYLDDFNAGYLLGKHSPELAELVNHMRGEGVKLMAIKDGLNEYATEKELTQEKERMPSWLKDDPFKQNFENNDPSKDLFKEPDIEPEI